MKHYTFYSGHTVTEMLSESQKTELKDLFSNQWIYGYELEGGLSFKKGTPLRKDQFDSALSHCANVFGNRKTASEVLDINVNGLRYTLEGIENIVEFCKTQQLPDDVKLMEKTNIKTVDIPDYGFRVRLSSEKSVNVNQAEMKNKFYAFQSSTKNFRIKKRYSVFATEDESPAKYRIDFTVVKQATGKSLQTIKLDEQYEIELEYIGKTKPDLDEFTDYMAEILKSMNKELILMKPSEKDEVLKEYISIVENELKLGIKGDLSALANTNPRKLFIGPNVVTLERYNLVETELTGAPSILTDYTVTDKADGERVLVFINKNGKVYMINNRMNIMATGLVCKGNKNTIIDAEFVVTFKGTYKLLCFDIYYDNKECCAERPLINTNSKDGTVSRYELLKKVLQKEQWNKLDYIQITSKLIVYYDGKTKLGDSCDIILTQPNIDYETDGLIFTPAKLPVGASQSSQKVFFGKTWEYVFKWKPPENNTIDFQVSFVKVPNTKVDLFIDNHKTMNLYVGSSACTPKDFFTGNFKQNNNNYKARLFDYSSSVKLPLVDGVIRCKNGDIIEDYYVVEMSYKKGQGWIPLRVRYDKYEQFLKTKEVTANLYQNALSVWRSIENPVTLKHLHGKETIEIVANDDAYYQRYVTRDKTATVSMTNFHNHWIKKRLLLDRARKQGRSSLFDIGCGKGGDLSKWIDNKYMKVLGVDVSEDNIVNPNDGIYKRLSENKFFDPSWLYAFVPLNAGNLINKQSINTITDDFTRELALTIWNYEKSSTPQLQRFNNLVKDKFDVVSCQFAIHYFFKDKEELANFIVNVKNHLKEGGLFVGTCFDGARVNKLFIDEGRELVEGKSDYSTVWKLQKCYDKYNPLAFGQTISVYVETINKKIDEYLVDFDTLVKEFGKYKIRLLTQKECKELDLSSSSDTFDKSFEDLKSEMSSKKFKHHALESALQMKDYEKKFSFLNRWFIFKYDPEMKEDDSKDEKVVPVPVEPVPSPSEPKKRGRPPKIIKNVDKDDKDKGKKPVGRPPKNKDGEKANDNENKEEKVKKPRGRPPKSKDPKN